jgi:UDP-N-acetylmuramoylalanine--D-glutamate ligase
MTLIGEIQHYPSSVYGNIPFTLSGENGITMLFSNSKFNHLDNIDKIKNQDIQQESYQNNNYQLKKHEKLLSLKNIKLVGEHNVSNVLAACLAVYLQTNHKELLEDVFNFNGVEHRIEYVKTIRGVSFFNDSKATNIDSVIVACKSFKNQINLILGGSDKGYNFDKLFRNLPKNVKNIAIFGETKHKIAFSAENCGFKNYVVCDNLEKSTLYLFDKSQSGDVVLLSPACASFDFFSNYEERGNFFKKIVNGIDNNESFLLCNKKKK